MVRKLNFFLSVLLVLVFGMGLSTCSLAAEVPTMSDEMARSILDYFSNNVVAYDSNNYGSITDSIISEVKNTLKNFDETVFSNYFNNNFKSVIEASSYTRDMNLTFNNITIYGLINKTSSGWNYYFYFVISNNTFPNGNTLGFQSYQQNYNSNSFDKVDSYDGQAYYNRLRLKSSDNSLSFIPTPPTTNKLSGINIFKTSNFNITFNNDNSIIYIPCQYALSETQTVYYIDNSTYYLIGNSYVDYEPPTPEEPDNPDVPGTGGSTGNITNPSGDTTGKVDLSGIESGIVNINQNLDKTNEKLDGISGEIGKLNENLTTVPDISDKTITSEDITGSFDFEFAEDPYANFWLELTTGLSGALTNNVRSIDVQFRGETYKIELDKFAIQTPEFLKSFLAILSTVFIFWKMIKYWKIIIDNITSGNMDEVLEMNEEERYY